MSTPEEPSQEGPAEAAGATIIRYPNRRLYDRSRGRYVTLQDVEETVRRGGTVTVRDSKTGEDLTRPILVQILLERHPKRMELFPVPFLHLALRANEVMLGVLREYVRRSLPYAELMQRAASFNPLLTPAEWMRTLMPGLPPLDNPGASSSAQASGDLDLLKSRIAELERRIEEVQAAPTPPGPGAAGKGRPGQ